MSNDPVERALACLASMPCPESVRTRLLTSVRRAWGPDGGLTPPRLAATVGQGLGLTDPDGLVAIVGLFYTAVDLSDDVSDGDAEPAAQGDPERLLLWLPEAAAALDPERGPQLLRVLSRGGLAMWDGQDANLASRGRFMTPDEVYAIAEGKAGEEVAAVFAAIAEAAEEPSEAWRELGRACGTALQLYSDLVDFGSGGRDWDARQPTWPLAVALAHPTWGPATCWAWAGDHRNDPRRAIGEALVSAAHDSATIDALAHRIEAGRDALPASEGVVGPLLEALHRWRSPPEAPPVTPPDPEPEAAHGWAVSAAAAFLRRDALLDEAVERHQRPLWGQPEVAAPLFGRLLAAWAARQAGVELDAAWEQLAHEPEHGYRYFPTVPEVALDTDLAGWLLTAGVGDPTPLREALEGALPRDLPTWLGPATGADGIPLTQHPCVASMASASRGLHSVGSPRAEEAWDRTLRARKLMGPMSPYYRPLTVDALLVDAAVECGVDVARLAVPIRTLQTSAGLSGLLGDLWTSAIATPALLQLDQHPCPESTHRALVDGLLADGGAPAIEAWQTIPRAGREAWYRSRSFTTAFIARALSAVSPPSLPVPPAVSRSFGGIASL